MDLFQMPPEFEPVGLYIADFSDTSVENRQTMYFSLSICGHQLQMLFRWTVEEQHEYQLRALIIIVCLVKSSN